MNFPYVSYKTHFENFGCSFYVLQHELPPSLNTEEKELLQEGGLPDEGLPFFYFDLHLNHLRDIFIEDCLLPLGTCLQPDSNYYIYVAKDHKIYTIDEHGRKQFVNSNLRALMSSLLCYSLWLNDIEDIVEQLGSYEVSNEDIFELYYELRSIDPAAVKGENLWSDLMITNLLLQIQD